MKATVIIITILLQMSFSTAAQDRVILKAGDRVCFIGNSITYAGGFFHYIDLFLSTNYPTLKLEVINCGVPGNRAAQVLARMNTDILPKRPDVSVLMLGMNDVRKEFYTPEAASQKDISYERQKALDTYRDDYEKIIQILIKNGSRVILQTPTIYDEGAELKDRRLPGRNNALRKCVAIVKQLAEKYRLPVIDYWTPMQEITNTIQQEDRTRTIIGPDRVHPGSVGHFIMSYIFLKTILSTTAFANIYSEVSKSQTHNTPNSDQQSDRTLSFAGNCNRVPFPMPPEALGALDLVPFKEILNEEKFCVSNLNPGRYKLLINDQSMGVFNSQQLSEGIDLVGNSASPQYKRSQDVLKQFRELWEAEARLRFVAALESGRAPLKEARNLDQVERYFKYWLSELKDTTTKEFAERQALRDNFLRTKRSWSQIQQRTRQLRQKIQQLCQPTAYHYQLIPDESVN